MIFLLYRGDGMYCIKVEPGRERIRVRHFRNGFLPSYTPADASGKNEGKRFIVPGYVFMMQWALGTEKVPDEEWAVIEAVSDPRLSVADPSDGKILEGPLKRIEKKVTAVKGNRALVEAVIFGKKRKYWLKIQTAGEGEPEPAGEENNREEKTVKKTKTAYTDEQRAEMLARAEEVGVQAAAKEFGVPWQVIAQFRRRAAEKAAAAAVPEDEEALRAENARLREKAVKLEAQVAKLKKKIEELM